jgi:hypothetical protein
MSAEQKPVCVVMDANIWLKESNLLLRTAMGSALLYMLKRIGGKIGLPSILEEEIVRNTIKEGVKDAAEIQKNFKIISVIIGNHAPYTVPDIAEITSAVQARITELETLFHKIPFSLAHAESAVKKINEKLPPNNHGQQFKDSAIWEGILELISSYTVHFVTEDKAFYKGGQFQIDNLANNLRSDCQERGGIVHIYPNMASCLKVIQKEVPPLDSNSLIVEIDSNLNTQLKRDLASEDGFEVSDLVVGLSSVSPFFTEDQNKLTLTFELCYQCYDIENTGMEERLDAVLKVKGDCSYEVNTHVISEIDLDFQRMYWLEPNGDLGRRGAVYLSSQKYNDRIKHTVREPLDFIKYPELNKQQRSELVLKNKKDFLEKYSEEQKAILKIFLNKYPEVGIILFRHSTDSLMRYSEFTEYGEVSQILKLFGGQEKLDEALKHLQNLLYLRE